MVAAAMLLLAFFVGSLAGMAVEEALGIDWFDFLDEDNRSAERALLTELDLSSEQRARIEEILERREARLEGYWEARIPEMRSLVAGSYEEVRAVLQPAQRERFDQRIRSQGIPLPEEPD
jgi:Spy/CpxP family protein refolding chaperone